MSAARQNNRMVLLLIAGLPVVVILASTWLWYYVSSGKLDLNAVLGTANRGTLLQPPREINSLPLSTAEGSKTVVPPVSGESWTLLIPASQPCGEACEHLLYYTRQIRTAMGKYTNHIDRVVLALGPDFTLPADLQAKHPGLKVVYTPALAWEDLVRDSAHDDAAPDATAPAYYLVDPGGWVMMYYRASDDGKDVMADLKFLIKNSEG